MMLGGVGRVPFPPTGLSLWPFHGGSQTGQEILWVGFVAEMKPRQGWTRAWVEAGLVPSPSADRAVGGQEEEGPEQLTLPFVPFPKYRGS